MNKKPIDLWVEYDSYGDYLSGSSSKGKNYKELIEILKNVDNKPKCYSDFPGLQISIMITDFNKGINNAAKIFYAVEEAIRYCEEENIA